MASQLNDSEYLNAWKEMDEAEKPKSKEQKDDGCMEKLKVISKALLTTNKPRTSTMGGVR